MSPLPPAIQPKLGSLLRLLGSPVDGEALGAARAIGRTLQGAGCDLHDLADVVEHPPAPVVIYRTEPAPARPSWWDYDYEPQPRPSREWGFNRKREAAAILQRSLGRGLLSEWEERFCYSVMPRLSAMYGGGGRLSDKQAAVVERLLRKIEASQ